MSLSQLKNLFPVQQPFPIYLHLSKVLFHIVQSPSPTIVFNLSKFLSVVISLLTGYLGLNGHLYKIGKDINPLCRRCLNGNETVEHLLCECESLTMSRDRILDKVFENFNSSHMSKWIYFDGLPQK